MPSVLGDSKRYTPSVRTNSKSLAIVGEKRQENLASEMQLGDLLDPLFALY